MNLSVSQATSASRDAHSDVLRYFTAQCFFGHILVARNSDGVCEVLIGDTSKEVEVRFSERHRDFIIQSDAKEIQEDLANMVRFMDGLANRWPDVQH